MEVLTVKQFVMLLTSQSVICAAATHSVSTTTNIFKYAMPIPRIICADGTSLSVQAHGNVHSKYKDIPYDILCYSKSFGEEVIACETDCDDLGCYECTPIEEIEDYVTSHGGIDIEANVQRSVKYALERQSQYINQNNYQ